MNNSHLEQKSAETGKGKIAYFCDMSFPGRPTVVLLHGLSSNHTTWEGPMKFLHERKYNVLAPDLRGHGFSDKSKNKELYRMPVFSDDLNKIIKKENINNFVLVGYSFGGQIALEYIDKHPENVKGLILISVNHVNPFRYWGIDFLSPVAAGLVNLAAAMLIWQKRKNYYYYQHKKSEGYWESVRHGFMTMPLSINFWMISGMADIDFSESIKKIKIPTVIVWSKKDFFVTKTEIKDMAKTIKGAKIIISKSKSHFIGTDSQDETIEIILDFLHTNLI
ncbi:MAG: alpha/beta hydrolase [Candidatus Paceibacterota bacterium]